VSGFLLGQVIEMIEREMILPISREAIFQELHEGHLLQGNTYQFADAEIQLSSSGGHFPASLSFQTLRMTPDGPRAERADGGAALTFYFSELPGGRTELIGYCDDERLIPEFDRVWDVLATRYEAEHEDTAKTSGAANGVA
jgi:hypothetical protein